MSELFAYEVEVATTSALSDTWQDAQGGYCPCTNGLIFIVTDDLAHAVKCIGPNVRRITRKYPALVVMKEDKA